MTVTVRFAPSPTGLIHIGNARPALFNWLFARKAGGRFILRFDDTDVVRSRQEYADAIVADLTWLGLDWDMLDHQSRRLPVYAAAVARLKAAGLLYPCYETADELELRRKIRLTRRLPPVYGRDALRLTNLQRAALESEGRKPHWRFLLPNYRHDPLFPERTEIGWEDLVRGAETVDLASLSDPVLVRADETFIYTLTSVADDIDMRISHVIRGDDHVTNTGIQIALFCALGASPPVFAHHNTLTTASGEGLSKRKGALSLGALRDAGYEPMAVASLAVLTGTSEDVRAAHTLDELAERFDLASVSKSAARFDPADLDALNRAVLHEMPFEGCADRLATLGVEGPKVEAFWLAVRGNLDRLRDAEAWWRIVAEGPEAHGTGEDDLAFVRQAFDLLPDEPWDRATWKLWTDAVKQATGRKGKALFMPLRLALTGRASGPELADLLPLLGRAGTMARRP